MNHARAIISATPATTVVARGIVGSARTVVARSIVGTARIVAAGAVVDGRRVGRRPVTVGWIAVPVVRAGRRECPADQRPADQPGSECAAATPAVMAAP